MKTSDFAWCLSSFLSEYLPGRINASGNTIRSYGDAFKLFLTYCRDNENTAANRIAINDVLVGTIGRFLDWLEQGRGSGISSRNQRLAAIKSFFRYVQVERPQYIAVAQKVFSIKAKKAPSVYVNYIPVDSVKVLLAQPNQTTPGGRRDAAMLSLLYDTGARVQELVDLSVKDIRLDFPAKVRLYGKGRKAREVPVMEKTARLMKDYLEDQGRFRAVQGDSPLFCNKHGKRMTRAGVAYVLKKYRNEAEMESPDFISPVTPHTMRHSKAMHLLQAGINLFYIKDLLGHVDISTTEVYAHADIETKRNALEAVGNKQIPASTPIWAKDQDLLEWLDGFRKER
jgi:site-specific recombinase XerD